MSATAVVTPLSEYPKALVLDIARQEIALRPCMDFTSFLKSIELPYTPSLEQLEAFYVMADPREREVLLIRSRGGSKTFDAMIVGLYYAYIGFKVIFWSPSQSQQDQPKEYLDDLTSLNFLQYCIIEKVKMSCKFDNGGWIKLKNLTEKQARSPRCDLEIFDEESQVDREAYDASSPVLSVSPLKKIIHISTPVKGTVFEENYLRMKEEGKPTLILRWDQCAHMNQDEEFILKEIKTKPWWWIKQEYFASFEAPHGRVFSNVQFGNYNHVLVAQTKKFNRHYQNFGLDWNPASGHYLGGSRWSDDYDALMITHEENLGTDMNFVMARIVSLLTANPKSYLEIEDGGTNSGYCELVFKWLYDHNMKEIASRIIRRPWDSQGVNKMKSIMILMTIVIYCDLAITPETGAWLGKATWVKSGESDTPKLKKDSEQHPLDALLHGGWIGRWIGV